VDLAKGFLDDALGFVSRVFNPLQDVAHDPVGLQSL
jgi:hypothetical protein